MRGDFAFHLTGLLLIVATLPVLIYYLVSYQATERSILKIASEHDLEILRNQKEYLNLQTEQIEALAANLSQVEEINNSLASQGRSNGSNTYDELAAKARIGYLLSNHRNLRGLVSIDLFSLDGRHYHVGDSLADSDERSDLKAHFMERTLKSPNAVVWHGVEDNVQKYSGSVKIVAATKLLIRPNSSWVKAEPVGMLLLNYSTDYLYTHFSSIYREKNGYLLVLDDQDRLIFSPNKAMIGTVVDAGFRSLLKGDSGSFIQEIDGTAALLSYESLPDKKWHIVSVIPVNSLLAPMASIQQVGIALLGASIFLAVVFVRFFASKIVQPIAAISDGFRRYQAGELQPQWRMEKPKSLAPIRELVDWFNAFLGGMELRQESETRLRIAATAFESQEGMLVTDENGVILQVNGAFTVMTGYGSEEVVGKTPRVLRSGLHDAQFYERMFATVRETGTWHGDIWNRRKDGSIYPEWLTITGVKNDKNQFSHFVATMTDITQRKASEDEIRNLAFFDPLTSLPNRRLLMDRLTQATRESARTKRLGALMFLDLDKFKNVNDTMGHNVGDQLLKLVGERLRPCLREGDTVARLGGDEFVILLEGLGLVAEEAGARAKEIATKVLAILSATYEIDGKTLQCTTSIGITLFSDAGTSTQDLMKQADIALYQSKEEGRNSLRFFDPAMQAKVMARAMLEADLLAALQDRQFMIYLQPKVDVDGGVVGAEALVAMDVTEKWTYPTLELYSIGGGNRSDSWSGALGT